MKDDEKGVPESPFGKNRICQFSIRAALSLVIVARAVFAPFADSAAGLCIWSTLFSKSTLRPTPAWSIRCRFVCGHFFDKKLSI